MVPVRYLDSVSNASPVTADQWDGRLYNNLFRDPTTTSTLIQWGTAKNQYVTYRTANANSAHPHNIFSNAQQSSLANSSAHALPSNVAFALGVATGTKVLGPLIKLPTTYPPSTTAARASSDVTSNSQGSSLSTSSIVGIVIACVAVAAGAVVLVAAVYIVRKKMEKNSVAADTAYLNM